MYFLNADTIKHPLTLFQTFNKDPAIALPTHQIPGYGTLPFTYLASAVIADGNCGLEYGSNDLLSSRDGNGSGGSNGG